MAAPKAAPKAKAVPAAAPVVPPVEAIRGRRKLRVGFVTSNKMQKTIVVQVRRLVRHPLYQRVIKQTSSFKVHDEKNEAKPGDLVKIMETRPLSKDKRWRLVEILKHVSDAPALPEGMEEQARHQAEANRAAKAKHHAETAPARPGLDEGRAGEATA